MFSFIFDRFGTPICLQKPFKNESKNAWDCVVFWGPLGMTPKAPFWCSRLDAVLIFAIPTGSEKCSKMKPQEAPK